MPLRDKSLQLRSVARRLGIKYVRGLSDDDLEFMIEEILRNEGIPLNEKLISELRMLGIVYAIPLNADHKTYKHLAETEGITVKMKSDCGRALDKSLNKVLAQLKRRGKCVIYYNEDDRTISLETFSKAGRKPLPNTALVRDFREFYYGLKKKHGNLASHPKVRGGLRRLAKLIGAKTPGYKGENTNDQLRSLHWFTSIMNEARQENKELKKHLKQTKNGTVKKKKKKSKKKKSKKKKVRRK